MKVTSFQDVPHYPKDGFQAHAVRLYIRTFVPSRLRAFVLSCFRAFVLSRLRAFVPSCLRAFAPSRLRAFAPSRLRAFVPSCLRAFVPSCLRAFAPYRTFEMNWKKAETKHGWNSPLTNRTSIKE
jgi:hypothetical protein